MPNPRQRNLPVDKQEGAELQRRKELYEQKTGQSGDWGKALGILTLGGLAATGVWAGVAAVHASPLLGLAERLTIGTFILWMFATAIVLLRDPGQSA